MWNIEWRSLNFFLEITIFFFMAAAIWSKKHILSFLEYYISPPWHYFSNMTIVLLFFIVYFCLFVLA